MRLARWLYLRGLGVVVLVAIGSLWTQLSGLIGSQGVWPAADQMRQLHQAAGITFFDVPTLAWLSASDGFLHGLAAAGMVLGVLLILGVAPRLVLGLLWLTWLSLVHVGGPFLSFQWDALLIEALFFSIFFAPAGWRPSLATEAEPPAAARFILQFLAFKVTFCSGVVKLASGDPSWRDLSAISYHYWTQPLPNWLSYVAHQWPLVVHQATCAAMFLIELPLAALALGPRQARLVAAAALLTLQAGLAAAGNYSYFNLLSAVLCLPLLDDRALISLAPKWRWPQLPEHGWTAPRWLARAGIGLAAAHSLASVLYFFNVGGVVLDALYPFSTINRYGAFAVMTKSRPEVILEGSRDGQSWTPWEFKYKVGRVDRRPGFIAPFQPRLDWQMWFAALSDCEANPWVVALQWKLLQGSPSVRALFETDPFAQAPPKFIRSTLWSYAFAPLGKQGVWWVREQPRPYCPALTLDESGQLTRMEP